MIVVPRLANASTSCRAGSGGPSVLKIVSPNMHTNGSSPTCRRVLCVSAVDSASWFVNDRPNHRAAQGCHRIDELLVLPPILEEPDDGPAAAGEVGAHARRPRHLDHPQVLRHDGHDRPP